MELDLGDLAQSEAPSQQSSRPSRFQPKSAKLKPKPAPKPEPASEALPPMLTKPEASDSPVVVVVDDDGGGGGGDGEVKRIDEAKEGTVMKELDLKPEEVVERVERVEEDPMEEDAEEDRVVREIDVVLCPPIDSDSQLCVLQYPLRPRWRPYELDQRCTEVRFKPKTSRLEIDLSLDVDRNYNANIPENMKITKQTLISSKAPLATSCAVGLLKGDKLYLNPIHAVMQLRPSMEHLKGGSKKKIDVPEEKTSGPSKKQGKPAKTSTEQNTDVETGISLEYHGPHSSVARKYREKMVSSNDSQIDFSMKPFDYIKSLCPVPSLQVSKTGHLQRRSLLSLPLEERIQEVLSKGPPIHQFNSFKYFAPDDSDDDILAVLQRHADLVQGLWVPNSTFLKLKHMEAAIRDYVLLLFSKNNIINSKQLEGSGRRVEVPPHVLSPFAIFRPISNDWKFRMAKDTLFLSQKEYRPIVRNQDQAWAERERMIMEAVGREVVNSSSSNMTMKDSIGANARQGTKIGANGKPSHGTTIAADDREALSKAVTGIFSDYKVCSLQLINQSLRDRALAKSSNSKAGERAARAAAKAASDFPKELLSIVNEIAIKVHSVYVAKSSENSTLNPLRNVVINLFRGKEPNAKLRKADIIEAAKISAKKDYSDTPEYSQVLNELCVSERNAWVLKSGDGNPQKIK
ncbi:hypothetical protein Scep_027094 [Stephania cephalantha]|uniref:DNA-directed RNA polymerase III subunit RPC5 n=1 Tax=Stephania cephalantha TaxID=152367 RepID=A0AAP0HTV2_9MAGN